jgi:hypothetical protein
VDRHFRKRGAVLVRLPEDVPSRLGNQPGVKWVASGAARQCGRTPRYGSYIASCCIFAQLYGAC